MDSLIDNSGKKNSGYFVEYANKKDFPHPQDPTYNWQYLDALLPSVIAFNEEGQIFLKNAREFLDSDPIFNEFLSDGIDKNTWINSMSKFSEFYYEIGKTLNQELFN